MSASLILTGALLCAASGLPALGRRRTGLPTLGLLLVGCLAGLAGSVLGLAGAPEQISAPWPVPGGALRFRVDALSAFFTLPVFFLAASGGLYVHRYWPARRARGGSVRFFFGVLAGALALVMVANQTMLFLALWEAVAVSSYFLVATESELPQVRASSWLYLAASHVATLCLFGVVALMHAQTGGWAFAPMPPGLASSPAGIAIFGLALVAFGLKAGLMPLHFWLPGAHAAGPSHVSAVMSGVLLKMGIYGLLRVLSLYDATPPWFGGVLLVAGLTSSILGVALALAQHDLKRLLAYHSIENIGIIVTGIGVGLLARASGHPGIAFLGFAGALLHVWNHSLFKALLFLAGGAAIRGARTREIDRMGGLARRMPATAAAFLLGAAAICGLPPLNGFVSEWLLYVASFQGAQRASQGWAWIAFVSVAPALAFTGALALACFVKAYGAVFLGHPRSAEAAEAREAPASMRLAMLPLALACLVIGIAPRAIAPAVARAAAGASGIRGVLGGLLAPVQAVALVAAGLLILAFLAAKRWRPESKSLTWDCGYAAPGPRLQYTASSFASGLTAFFAWAVPTTAEGPRRLALFPARASFASHVSDPVLDRALVPALRRMRSAAAFARRLQGGRVQIYLLYLGAALLLLLAWSSR